MKEKLKHFCKVFFRAVSNPRFLLCFFLGWMITNGWCYVFIGLGGILGIRWMTVVGAGYAGILWFPGTPEKIITLAISIFLMKRLFPNDERTLKLLHDEKEKVKAHHEAKKQEKQNKNKPAA